MDNHDVTAALRAVIPERQVLSEADLMARYVHDEAAWAAYGGPAAVVRAERTADVAAAVQVCARLGVPVVTRGAGTGLSGGANAVEGCVVISTEAMNSIVEINVGEQLAVVQPGVVNDVLRAEAAKVGLWYPPDPASSPWSTIGGNAATNAGGLCCVKYGVTRDYVLGLEVVVGAGDVVRLGRRTAKGVVGYDLVSLFVGSEGTLGVITELTMRLKPLRQQQPRTVVGYFDSLSAAGDAVAAVFAAGIIPTALELIDRASLVAVDEWKHMGLSAEATVLLLGQSDVPGPAGDDEALEIQKAFDTTATWSARSTDDEEANSLFAARRLAYPAMERLGPVLTEDICVPRMKVTEMLERIQTAARVHDTQIANVAHAGDGNLHPLIITPRGDPVARERAVAAFDDIIAAAVELGGTTSGEHGVGLLKRHGLRLEQSPEVVTMQQAVKFALDPLGIFNPGKVIGDPALDTETVVPADAWDGAAERAVT
jgi:glycolate oxidase